MAYMTERDGITLIYRESDDPITRFEKIDKRAIKHGHVYKRQ